MSFNHEPDLTPPAFPLPCGRVLSRGVRDPPSWRAVGWLASRVGGGGRPKPGARWSRTERLTSPRSARPGPSALYRQQRRTSTLTAATVRRPSTPGIGAARPGTLGAMGRHRRMLLAANPADKTSRAEHAAKAEGDHPRRCALSPDCVEGGTSATATTAGAGPVRPRTPWALRPPRPGPVAAIIIGSSHVGCMSHATGAQSPPWNLAQTPDVEPVKRCCRWRRNPR